MQKYFLFSNLYHEIYIHTLNMEKPNNLIHKLQFYDK